MFGVDSFAGLAATRWSSDDVIKDMASEIQTSQFILTLLIVVTNIVDSVIAT